MGTQEDNTQWPGYLHTNYKSGPQLRSRLRTGKSYIAAKMAPIRAAPMLMNGHVKLMEVCEVEHTYYPQQELEYLPC